ncbi:hypothetical protein [Mycolicibacterium sp.]|uniref:hypothetical protein n=1 Tax=Mycolicibacterium sp. TaxID=2320850 RepID=UPI00355CA7C6
MSDLTVAAGANAALVFEFAEDTDSIPAVSIVDADDVDVVTSTSTGVAALGSGVYSYVWRIASAQTAGAYTATLSGEIESAPVERELTVAVTGLPVYTTLGLVKESLVAGGQTAQTRDVLLQQKIATASRAVDDYCGRRFYLDAEATQRVINPRSRSRRDRDGDRLLVDDIGSATGVTVEVGSGAGWVEITGSVELEPTDAAAFGRPFTSLLRGVSWLAEHRVRVTARWGWPAVPQPVQEATLLQTVRLLKRKDSPEGVLGSAEWGAVRVSRVDPDVAALLAPYVLDGFG